MGVDDLDLDGLLATLREVASASDPDADSDMDPNDDPDNGDFDPNDDPDNVDSLDEVEDDPCSYVNDDDDDNEGPVADRSGTVFENITMTWPLLAQTKEIK